MSDFLPPIVGKLLGDTRDFNSKLQESGRLTQTETASIEERHAQMRQRVGVAMGAAGGAIAAAGIALTKLGDDSKRAEGAVRTAINNTGKNFDDFKGQVDSTANRLIKFGFDDEDTARAIAKLTTATQDPAKSIKMMGLVADVAASQHIGLEAAAALVAKGVNGNTKVFKQFGITVDAAGTSSKELAAAQKLAATSAEKAKDAHQNLVELVERQGAKAKLTVADHQALKHAQEEDAKAADIAAATHDDLARKLAGSGKGAHDAAWGLDELGKRVAGRAAADADNFSTKVQAMKIRLENIAESVGQKVGPAMTMLGPLLLGVSGIMTTGLIPAIVSATVAAAPWILAIGAVVAAGYLLWRNWDTIIGFLKGVVSGAFNFVKQHFDLIALAVLGPLGPLVVLVRHWSEAKDAIIGVGREIVQFIADKLLGAFEWIVRGAASAFGWVPGIGPKLKEAAKAIEAFRDDVNNSLDGIHDKTVNVNIVSHALLPKDTPHAKGIPQFALGGTIPGPVGKPQLVIAHGGETVVPPGMDVGSMPGGGGSSTGAVTIIVNMQGATILGGSRQELAESLAPAMRDALIRGGFRQQLGFSN